MPTLNHLQKSTRQLTSMFISSINEFKSALAVDTDLVDLQEVLNAMDFLEDSVDLFFHLSLNQASQFLNDLENLGTTDIISLVDLIIQHLTNVDTLTSSHSALPFLQKHRDEFITDMQHLKQQLM